ncbi:hypothetical protein C6Y14_32870 [Streptomyces dioscori]|uniref:Uncharacterized protein n=1 Tax=Streptomyces dioscori TaxID=2109333 RepID=A0A2P8PZ35_9ACTN|nr:hypothetical protein C6Y14_32870 [Streptomyces dioscori]
MTNPLPSKSHTRHPTGPPAAEPAGPPTAVSDPKGVAEGVPTAVGSDPQAGDDRYPIAWLTISTPYRAVPIATSWCMCGRDRHATGDADVWALIADHEAHRDTCPLRTTQEGRAAA